MQETIREYDGVFFDDPNAGALSGDYIVERVEGDTVILFNKEGDPIYADRDNCTYRDWYDTEFPNWALCYFVNNDEGDLSLSELKQVDDYVTGLRNAGFTEESVTDDVNEFCAHPAFGCACDTTRVRFYRTQRKQYN